MTVVFSAYIRKSSGHCIDLIYEKNYARLIVKRRKKPGGIRRKSVIG